MSRSKVLPLAELPVPTPVGELHGLGAVSVRELGHTKQDRQDGDLPELVTLDCIGREVAAQRGQARVWA